MKALLVMVFIVGFVILFVQCSNGVENKKDLDENMLDLAMYSDNLGLYLRKQDADYSLWLLDGLDSTLQILSITFTEHRKLLRPFKQSYNKELAPPINDIRKALYKTDFPKAVESYRLLINNCNDCHIDLEIDKTVVDWSKAGVH
ncbi:hypothetical protein [Lacibacter sediminis]|uniref:Cytochrome C n=1 Tax=Lacibacter sediminis TaxID=2760713 RepID=A0A7G5XGS1_9BACT|nr:hypothetical protein [Lacibacter sediminis]QNA44674.1 hypothetical protein H4075_00310 [Lacibacter sediminis]